jgi:nucleotide-binding universal stress UspA family protein
MYEKMLVILDGSKLAEQSFTYAQELAGRLNLCLELLHVSTPQEADQVPMRQAYMEHMAEVLQEKTELIRSESREKLACETIAQGHVVVGDPAEEILKYVEEHDIDLLMLSKLGKSGNRRWNIGSVAHKIIHNIDIPVWIVPSELREEIIQDKMTKKTLVITLDGSKLSEGVIPHAIAIAKQRGAESGIVVVFVEEDPVIPLFYPTESNAKQIEESRIKIKQYLEDVVKRIGDSGISARSEILRGNPAIAILDYIRDNPPQLLAMATHSREGFNKIVFGSVVESVLQAQMKTPILIVRPKV